MPFNDNQEKVASHDTGRAMALACPGSGKTTVVTERTIRLLRRGVLPHTILSVTFTNKACNEMKERLVKKYGEEAQKVMVTNFHGLCGRILRRFGSTLGYTEAMTIADTDDQEGLIKKIAMKRYTAAGYDEDNLSKFLNSTKVRSIASACNWSRETLDDDYPNSLIESGKLTEIDVRIIAEYLKTLRERNQCDFSGMLSETIRLLKVNPAAKEMLQNRFQYIQVDEMQDTNKAQMEIIELVAAAHDNILGVGDIDQCVIGDTLIATPNGAVKASEITKGQMVSSGFGQGKIRPSKVAEVSRRFVTNYPMARLHVRTGEQVHVLECTAEHRVFAGFDNDHSPNRRVIYLMHRPDMGFRVGTTSVRMMKKNGQILGSGVSMRSKMEKATRAWVIGTCQTGGEAAEEEQYLSCRYGIPTWTFEPPSGSKISPHSFKKLFSRIKTEKGGHSLLKDSGHRFEMPTYCRGGTIRNGLPPTIRITLVSDSRSQTPFHRISSSHLSCCSRSEALDGMRRAERFRFDGHSSSLADLRDKAHVAVRECGSVLQEFAAIGGNRSPATLPYTLAGAVKPAMIMYVEHDGEVIPGVVERVDAFSFTGDVYDFEVKNTHNFIANGLFVSNSIYSWRGANPEAIDAFISRGKNKTGTCSVYKLDTNYRSTPQIIARSSQLIACSAKRHSMEFKASNADGEPVRSHFFVSPEEEANWVGQQIVNLIAQGQKPTEIAVFFRQNDMSRLIEQALVRRGVAYKVAGSGSFYDRMEVKDTLSVLKVICNPKDTAAFHRIANKPARAMSDTSLGMIENYCSDSNVGLLEALSEPHLIAADVDGKTGRVRKNLTAAAVTGCRTLHAALGVPQQGKTIYEVADHALKALQYDEYLKEKYEGKEYDERRRNLNELLNAIKQFAEDAPKASLADYLQSIALFTESQDSDKEDGVRLMSIHGSKGLEFDNVFVLGCEEGICPHKRVITESGEAGIEEERRLFYVAMTRARKRLKLLHCITRVETWGKGGKAKLCNPSRFLIESGVLAREEADRIMKEAIRRGYGVAPSARGGDDV